MHKNGKSNIIGLILMIGIIGIGIVICVYAIFDSRFSKDENENPSIFTSGNVLDNSDYRVMRPNADEYYEKYAERIISVTAISDSIDVWDKKELSKEMEDRGLSSVSMRAEYTMDGKITDDQTEKQVDRSPQYQGIYQSSTGDLWGIIVINGRIMANPVSYNMSLVEKNSDIAKLVIAENISLMGYDSQSEKFYEMIPFESEIKVKTVDRIDADTLDRLTIEQLSSHEKL